MINFAKNELFYTEAYDGSNNFKKALIKFGATDLNANAPLMAFVINGNYTFDLSSILVNNPIFKQALPTLPTEFGFHTTDLVKSIEVLTAALSSTVFASKTTLMVHNGKIPQQYFELFGQNYIKNYFSGQFLSNRKNSEIVSLTQPIFYHFATTWDNLPTGIKLYARFGGRDFYTDPVYLHDDYASVVLNKIYFYSFSPSHLLDFYDGYQEVEHIDLFWVSDTQTFEQKRLIIDYNTPLDEVMLCFQNIFGVWETVRLEGERKDKVDVKSETAQIKNKTFTLDSEVRDSFSITLGKHNSQHSKAIIQDLAFSDDIYMIQDQQFVLLNKSFSSLESYTSTNQYDNPTLEFYISSINR
ncbi:hypothetical protein [Flectobacillus sp. BAB-3569]|uniref:hypothetical protein n=1 Tax=Flectobacillus sp. BAB-3569 TaxID=1509483 RepID=UPI000BA331FB|nr:hypothetical protein [Flectobacillus sp. BAB-3569]PAC27773.1 hypothetical protein BWI92_21410 [Flectobacillus sp. BAB-3569]